MSGMTSERLALIHERIDYTGYAPWKTVTAELLDEVERLTAENARLREGIEALLNEGRVLVSPVPLRALLNPPTEGETDE